MCRIFMTIFLICLLSLQVQPVFAAGALPAASFRLSCFDDERTDTEGEMDAILALHAFAAAHNGEAVWLDAAIRADAGAGFCSRDLSAPDARPRNDEGEANRISFNGCGVEKGRRCIEMEMVQIDADGPPLAYRHSVVLPREALLPKNLPYRTGKYGDWLNYQGPFIARHHEGTGYAYATFHVPDAALAYVWERAAKMPKTQPDEE